MNRIQERCLLHSRLVGLLVLLLTAAAPAAAQETELVIATKEAAPFAMKAPDGTWKGISIDLWQTDRRAGEAPLPIRRGSDRPGTSRRNGIAPLRRGRGGPDHHGGARADSRFQPALLSQRARHRRSLRIPHRLGPDRPDPDIHGLPSGDPRPHRPDPRSRPADLVLRAPPQRGFRRRRDQGARHEHLVVRRGDDPGEHGPSRSQDRHRPGPGRSLDDRLDRRHRRVHGKRHLDPDRGQAAGPRHIGERSFVRARRRRPRIGHGGIPDGAAVSPTGGSHRPRTG